MEGGLLAEIQRGKALKKAQTNDRSAPIVDAKKASKPSGGGMARPPMPGMGAPPPIPGGSSPSLQHTASAPPVSAPAAPQLGGLFAHGMPTLRKTRGAVDTGRGLSSSTASTPSAPHNPPPPTPGRSPVFNNSVKPPKITGNNTLPRNFKAPPPIPGRALPQFGSSVPSFGGSTPSFGSSAPSSGGAPPPPPPPPPGGGPSGVAIGVSPKIQAALIPPVPGGRSRSNSSPLRPVPPPPPRAIPSPPPSAAAAATSLPRGPPKFALPSRPPPGSLAVPPVLPPGRPRSASNSSFNKPGSPQQRNSPVATPPRSPLPPPPSVTPVRAFGGASAAAAAAPPPPPPPPPPPGGPTVGHNPAPAPPQANVSRQASTLTPLMGLRPSAPTYNTAPQVTLTEGGGRYTFRPTSDLPLPRTVNISRHVYPSGESKGNAYPLDYSRFR